MNNQSKYILIWVSVFVVLILSFNSLLSDGLGGEKQYSFFGFFI